MTMMKKMRDDDDEGERREIKGRNMYKPELLKAQYIFIHFFCRCFYFFGAFCFYIFVFVYIVIK